MSRLPTYLPYVDYKIPRLLFSIPHYLFTQDVRQLSTGNMQPRDKAHLEITLTTSSSTISLSQLDLPTPFQLLTTARVISSSKESFPITRCTSKSVLDNGEHNQHDGLFRGAFSMESISDPNRRIQLRFNGSPNYLRPPDTPNLLEWPSMRFKTIPARDQGVLTIKHDLPLERMFRYERTLKPADIKPGEKFRVRMSSLRLNWVIWWAFGDLQGDLKGKRFAKWQLPDEEGQMDDIMPGDEEPDIDRMQAEGWVFSERHDNLTANGNDEGAVFEFVE